MNQTVPFASKRTPLSQKSTLEEIRARFDQDVERFSNLETGQRAAPDAPLVLEMVAQCASSHLRPGARVLDLGCGAGNFTLRLLKEVHPLECHMVDLSGPMLDRACSRLHEAGVKSVHLHQIDLRQLPFKDNSIDCIVAAAVLHHLRDDADWADVFGKLFRWLKPGGALYVADVMLAETPAMCDVMWSKLGQHLESVGGAEYRGKVFDYIDKEDSPRSLMYQIDLLRRTGFTQCDVLHRNGISGCYCGFKESKSNLSTHPGLEETVVSLAGEFSQNGV